MKRTFRSSRSRSASIWSMDPSGRSPQSPGAWIWTTVERKARTIAAAAASQGQRWSSRRFAMARSLANPRWSERAGALYTGGVNSIARAASAGIRASFAAGLLLGLALSGCEAADPLEAIRQQQASGDYAGSVARLRELLKERHDDPEVNYLYGRALVNTGQASLATWSLRQAMEDPEWLEAAGLELAQAGLVAGDFNE